MTLHSDICTELHLFSLVSVTLHSDPLHWTLPVQSGICDFTQWSLALNSTCSVWYLWLYTVIPCTELYLFSLVSVTLHNDPLHRTPPVQFGICDFTQWSPAPNSTCSVWYLWLHTVIPCTELYIWSSAPNFTCSVWYLWLYTMIPCTELYLFSLVSVTLHNDPLHQTLPVQSDIWLHTVILCTELHLFSLVSVTSHSDPLHWTLPVQSDTCDFTQWSLALNSTCSVWYLWLHTVILCTELHLFSLISVTSHSDPLHWTPPVQSDICDFTQWSSALNSTCSVWYLWLHTVIPCTKLYLFSLISVTSHSDPLHWTPPVQFGICDFTQWSSALNSTCSVWCLWLHTVILCTELHLFSLMSVTSHSDPLHWTPPVQSDICDFTQWSSALNSACSVWYLWLHTVILCTELHLFSLVSVTSHSDPLCTELHLFSLISVTSHSDPLHWTPPVQFHGPQLVLCSGWGGKTQELTPFSCPPLWPNFQVITLTGSGTHWTDKGNNCLS